jgi:hypothetical protein
VQNLLALAEQAIGRGGVRLSVENSGGLSFRSMGLLLGLARRQVRKLAQLQPFIAVFPHECMGQLASFGPT